MNIQADLLILLTAAGAAFLAALAGLLASPKVSNLVTTLGVRAAADTNKAVAEADALHNALLSAAIHAAMTYAENHEAEVLKDFDTKASYVESVIEEDPRFAHLNLPMDAIKHLIEQLYQAYFSALPHSTPIVAPNDTPGSPVQAATPKL
jgi:hypothetical protein